MSESTITPTAIDAYVPIDAIDVNGRHRRDLGDVQALADSIADVGLLNPITLTREGRLVAGHRRLEAIRTLGWDSAPVRFADNLDDAAKLLRAERDENVCRLDMKPSELAALGEALYEIESQHAKERQAATQLAGRSPGGKAIGPGPRSGTDNQSPRGDARDLVGEALGMAGGTYSKLRFAHRLANDPEAPADERALARDALAEMDRTNTVTGPAKRLRGEIRARRDAQEAKAAAVDPEPSTDSSVGTDWIPAANEKNRQAVARRRELIAEYGRGGYTSHQIGDKLGILAQTIRNIARVDGIEITADRVIGRSHHRIDSNRVVREIVQQLENTEMSLRLVHFDELDVSQIENWTDSLSKSIRMLNRLNKQLKEKVQ